MKILLTGAGGLMGGATAVALARRGDEVTVFQRRPSGLGLREILGDIADPDAVDRAATGQDVVLHAAAKVDVVGKWADYERINVQGTANMVRACRSAGVHSLIHVSSPSVAHAGQPLVGAPAGAADPATARGHYARSKAQAELIALAADGAELAVLCLRPHLVWGPGDLQLIDPILQRARARRLALVGSGTALIDTTYVDNAVDALLAAVDAVGPIHGESLVVTNGEPRPVGEILRRICEAAGVSGPHRQVPLTAARALGGAVEFAWSVTGRSSRPPLTRFLAEQLGTAHWFDQRRTRTALQWLPRVSLDRGFELLAESYRR